ncbi:MAG: WD40 repeat domain-containing protein, partial [Gemmataceae bacterium]
RSRSLDVPIRKVAIGDGGAKFYVATTDGKLRVFDAKTMEQTEEFAIGKEGALTNFELMMETTVMAGERGQPPTEWDVPGKKALREFTGPVRPGYRRLLLSADKKVLAAHDEGMPATVWDVEQGKYVRAPAFPDTVDIALSADGKRLLAAGTDDRLRLIDLTDGKVISTFADSASESVTRLVFSPDGRKAAGGGKGGRIWIWDVDSGKVVHQSSRFDGEVRDLAFTADGKKLVGVADADGVLVWDVAAKEEPRFFPMRQGGVSVTLTPDGKYAVTARAMDNVIQVWRLP